MYNDENLMTNTL